MRFRHLGPFASGAILTHSGCTPGVRDRLGLALFDRDTPMGQLSPGVGFKSRPAVQHRRRAPYATIAATAFVSSKRIELSRDHPIRGDGDGRGPRARVRVHGASGRHARIDIALRVRSTPAAGSSTPEELGGSTPAETVDSRSAPDARKPVQARSKPGPVH